MVRILLFFFFSLSPKTNYPTEVDRAVDNLVKSGKMFAPQRRDSLPVLSPRGFPEHGMSPYTFP